MEDTFNRFLENVLISTLYNLDKSSLSMSEIVIKIDNSMNIICIL